MPYRDYRPDGYNVNLPAEGPVRPAIPPKAPPMRPVPPAVAAYTLEERQRLLDRIAQLEDRYQRDVHGLNNEGDPIGGDPAGGYANDNARLRAELDACCAALPGTLYMDPPDGGDVPVSEQLRRMGEDAARWRAVMQYGEGSAFEWFTAKYVQRADERQAALGLQYTEAETHDLAKSVMSWLRHSTLADYGFQAAPPVPAARGVMRCAIRGVLRGINGMGVCGSVINAETCGSTGYCKHQQAVGP